MRDPLVPVTVTMYTPVGEVLVAETRRLSVAVWPADSVTVGCSIEIVKPDREDEVVKEIVPTKPFRLVTWICDCEFCPS